MCLEKFTNSGIIGSMPENATKPLSLRDDPFLGARLSLPGVTRYIKLRRARRLAVAGALLALASLTVSYAIGLNLVGALSGAVLLVLGLTATVAYSMEVLATPAVSIPGERIADPF